MKLGAILPLLLLWGCVPEDRMILRDQQDLEAPKPRGSLFKSSSFWDMARTIEKNAPQANEAVFRKGRVQFSTQKTLQRYDFDYEYTSPQQWNIILFEKDTKNKLFSLHRNHFGLTLQDIQDQIFEQSYESDIWKKLEDHPWLDSLQATLQALEAPKFSPELDWHEEADGLMYYILTRVEQSSDPKDAIKHQLYLHKKGRTLNRHIMSQLDIGIIEDIRYGNFIAIGKSYLPHQIMIEFPKKMKRVDLDISETQIQPIVSAPNRLKNF
jgi:hypothetical protein